MIKVVNLIWLGNRPLYDKYLDSVKKYLPDWEIKIWGNDELKDIECEYFKGKMKKGYYAVASDYARFKILYEHGGLYIDTDVEFLQGIDDLVEKGSFFGVENLSKRVSSGVIMYLDKPYSPIMKFVLDKYEETPSTIYIPDGILLCESLKRYGYKEQDLTQTFDDFTVYDSSYFCPTRPKVVTTIPSNTRCIHHYTNFWRDGL